MEVNISPAIVNPNHLSSTRFVPINFNHSLSVKLDNKNFSFWKQKMSLQFEAMGYRNFCSVTMKYQFNFSPEKMRYLEKQLRNSLSGYNMINYCSLGFSHLFLSRFFLGLVGCDTSFLLWGRLEQYFASQTRAKAKQFKTQLQHTKKGGSKLMNTL